MTSILEPKTEGAAARLGRSDYALLVLLGLLLFGYCMISGKPLTMHEARLPQVAREMLAEGQWLLPHSGERPWLERPPFPHWVELGVGHVVGRLDAVWIVRIAPALMGILTLLIVAWTTARLFGRRIAMLSAAALATMYEFYFYAGQAEDDIFLAFLVAASTALFVAAEFPRRSDPRTHFLGNRPPTVWWFFIVLGLTSLAKGPLVGASEVVGAVGVFLLLSWQKQRICRYIWLWGWLLFAVISVAWYAYAYSVYPGIWDNLRYDFTGPYGHERRWYYLPMILGATAPWTPLWIAGLILTWKHARDCRSGSYAFLWCWALVPLLVLSVPARKHHHYLVPILPAYAVLCGFALEGIGQWLTRQIPQPRTVLRGLLLVGIPGAAVIVACAGFQKIPGPMWTSVLLAVVFVLCTAGVCYGLERLRGDIMLVAILAGFIVTYGWGQSVLATRNESKYGDLELLARARNTVPADKPLLVEAYDTLDFFRNQFYLRGDARVIQNVTFLRDQRLTAPQVYLVARYNRRDFLSQLGTCEVIDRSRSTRRERSPEARFTLFRITFRPDLQRYPAPTATVLQGLYRGNGIARHAQPDPYCGPPFPAGEPCTQPSE